MKIRYLDGFGFSRSEGGSWHRALAILVCCVGLLAGGVIATTPSVAASIPAWLDDAISRWNAANPDSQLRFANIKDSFVWYQMPKAADLGHAEIRQRIDGLVLGNNYKPTDDEELITTGKPPVLTGRVEPKKCWNRSFVLDIEAQGDTKAVGDDDSAGQRQRLLTRLVCEDATVWWAAFRVAG